MSACSQCGTVAKATDKFCNVCGTPLPRANADGPPSPPGGGWGSPGAPPPAAPPFGGPPAPGGFGPPPAGGGFGAPPGAPPYAPPPGPGGFGPPPNAGGFGPPPAAPPFGSPGGGAGARCQAGHEIAPGASYCAQGHPIALDQMQFSNNDPYGGGAPGFPPAPPFGAPPRGAPGGFAPPPAAPPFQPSGGGFGPPGAPPPSPGFPQAGPPFAPPAAQTGPGGFQAPAPAYAPPPAAPFAGGYAPDPAAAPAPAKMLRGFLVAYNTNPAGDFWPLTGGRLVIGRAGGAEGTDIPMQDPTISSRHAAILVDAASGSIVLEDTGSTNGTFVNDEHIGFNGRRDLRDGDRVRFGGYTTIVKVIGRV